MKKYVILGYLYGIGGWQTYIANKLKLMEDNGWTVYGINNGKKPMRGGMLPILERFKNNNIYALSFSYPSEIGNQAIADTLKKIADYIQFRENDEVIFEATLLDLFMWAELLAKHFSGRGVCVEVSNRFRHYPHPTLDFFYFKQQRGELLMMLKTGLHELFDGYITYPLLDNNTVGALTQNAFIDDGKDYAALLDTAKSDYIIGTVGWLNKGYYIAFIDEVISFSKQHQDKVISLIVVGASSRGNIESLYKEKAKGIPNLRLHLMGAIAPIPSNLIKLFDVSVASYGCAQITDILGVTTICMHDPDNIPLGVLSYTMTEPPLNRRANFDKTISDMLTDVLINRDFDRMERKQFPHPSIDNQKIRHLEAIRNMSPEKKYYNIQQLPNREASFKHKLRLFFLKCFGMKITEKVMMRVIG